MECGECCPCPAVGLSPSSAPEARKSKGAGAAAHLSSEEDDARWTAGAHSPSSPGTACLQGAHSALPQGSGAPSVPWSEWQQGERGTAGKGVTLQTSEKLLPTWER